MSALALLQQLHDLRITLAPSPDGMLHCRAPQGILTPALVDGMRQHKAALLGLLAASPAPLTQYYPCVVCSGTDRWDDDGIWRCRGCSPTSLTDAARQTEWQEQAYREEQLRQARPPRAKPRDPELGPILPFCGCGDHRYWHHHAKGTWECWTCVPPGEPSL